jgi:hypothetical protein
MPDGPTRPISHTSTLGLNHVTSNPPAVNFSLYPTLLLLSPSPIHHLHSNLRPPNSAMRSLFLLPITFLLTLLPTLSLAQFQFFEQMFHPQQQAPQEPQNVASDSNWYQRNYEDGNFLRFFPSSPLSLGFLFISHLSCPIHMALSFLAYRTHLTDHSAAHCTNYLCPGTLACVHFPHHCPCAFPNVEDKVELGEGSMICVSKGGWAVGEAGRKVELARKGLL